MIPILNLRCYFSIDMKHLLSATQFSHCDEVEELLDKTSYYKTNPNDGSISTILKNKIICTMFFEPSTRTRLSFESASLRLGAKVISCENAQSNASSAKGETLDDAIKVIAGYADGLVIRHPEKNSLSQSSIHSTVPIINAGDGNGEHPTQGLLDLFTIKEKLGTLNNLTIGFVGDIKNARTVHSTIRLLSLYTGNTFKIITPPTLKIDSDSIGDVTRNGNSVIELTDWNGHIESCDVIYMTRTQKERFESSQEYYAVKDNFILTQDIVAKMKKNSIILHPLPRVNEIHPSVDSDQRSCYFQQAHNGVFTRMAILEMLLR